MEHGIKNFQPHRLTQARAFTGWPRAVLADKLGVSRATVNYWESGQHSPSEHHLKYLSRVLEMPLHWFLRQPYKADDGRYFIGSGSKALQEMIQTRLDWMAELSLTFQQWLHWPTLSAPCSDEHFLNLSDEEIELMADKVRSAARIGSGPVADMVLTLENCGIICARNKISLTKVHGAAHWSTLDQRPFVLLSNDSTTGTQSRFDTAQALAHIVLHRHISPEDQQQYAKEITRQASLFAYCFLLPAVSFAREIIDNLTVETLLAMKPRWKVSIAHMINRCHQLHLIDDRQKTRLFKRLSAKAWRVQEPYDNQVQHELPRLFPRAAHMLIDQNILTKAALLEALGFSETVCESLCSLRPGFFRDTPPDIDNLIELKLPATHRHRQQGQPADLVRFPDKNR